MAAARLELQCAQPESAKPLVQRGLEMAELLPRESPKPWDTKSNRELYAELRALWSEASSETVAPSSESTASSEVAAEAGPK